MKAMPTVYLETSALSVLVARRSLSEVESARQVLTRAWWKRRGEMAIFTSRIVRDESATGDAREVKKRLAIAQTLADLPVGSDSEDLAAILMRRGALPAKAATDALHLAIATVHQMEYLVSWNCRHLVNTHILNQVFRVVEDEGYNVPRVLTPETMLELL
jgi:hypothetical protein